MSHRLAVATLSFLAWTGVVEAQETASAADLQRDVEVAQAEVLAATQELRAGLLALVPSVPGWSCQEQERREDAPALNPIPSVQLRCEHPEQSLHLTLLLDPSTATVVCQSIASDQQGITDGRIVPDLFRFFEGGMWRVARASVDLRGCAADAVALMAQGDRSEEAIAQGPAVIDAFAEAVLASDPGPLLEAAEASGHAAALERLVGLLDAQSRLLADLIPAPAGATREIRLPSLAQELGLPLPMVLSMAPSASGELDVQGCSLIIELSASPLAIHEAANTGLRWARPGGEDGAVLHAFIRRNTDRFVGQERVDGTGIEVLVDGAVLVRVVIPGNRPCDADPEIVSRLFEEVLTHDLSAFAAP